MNKLTRPLVICIGLGTNFGGHDSNSVLERYLDSLTSLEGLILVIATGNEGTSAHHFSGILFNKQVIPIELNVSQGETGFPMWIWAHGADKISVSIQSPLGQLIDRIPTTPYQTNSFTFSLEKTRIFVTYIYPELKSGNELITISFSDPTPGIWTINITGDFIIDGDFNVWLPNTGFILLDTRLLSSTPFTTLTVPSSAKNTIAVGGYNSIDGSIYAFSGRGPTTSLVIKPDIVAPCINISAPAPGGSYIIFQGTSIAAAITAGACAILFQWGILNSKFTKLNTRSARTILIRGATRKQGVTYPNPIEGYGKLDLKASISLV